MKRWFLIALGAAFLLPTVAAAYVPSPQHGALEIKFGPYRPEMSTAQDTYKNLFKNDMMFLTALELDWQIWHPPGFSLGIGGTAGFMQAVANARIQVTNEDGTTDEGAKSADFNVLNVIPCALLAVIRVDALADMLRIPFVPYFKGGLSWYYWWTLNGGSVPSKGRGGSLGWQLNPGIMFRLDQFDETSARTFDNEVGVNHSYLFAELNYTRVDGFGRDGYLDFSEKMFLAGLALEF